MSEELFYIATTNHTSIWPGGVILWWAPDAKGYSTTLEQAGKYPREQAESICAEDKRGNDYMVRCSDAEAVAVRVVDLDKLREITVRD